MKAAEVFIVVMVAVLIHREALSTPVERRQHKVSQDQQPQRNKVFFPWYTDYPDTPFLPAYPDMWDGANYYPPGMGLADPYDFIEPEEFGIFRSGQKKPSRQHHPKHSAS